MKQNQISILAENINIQNIPVHSVFKIFFISKGYFCNVVSRVGTKNGGSSNICLKLKIL